MWQWRARIKTKYYCFHVNSYWPQNCYSYTSINLELLHFPAKLLENLEVQHQYLYLCLALLALKLMSTFSSHMVSTVLTYSLVTVGGTVFSSGALSPFRFSSGFFCPAFFIHRFPSLSSSQSSSVLLWCCCFCRRYTAMIHCYESNWFRWFWIWSGSKSKTHTDCSIKFIVL